MTQVVESASTALVSRRLFVVVAWTSVTSGQLLYSRWKKRVIALCSGRTTLTIIVPSAARV
jgi:hypothetical protein